MKIRRSVFWVCGGVIVLLAIALSFNRGARTNTSQALSTANSSATTEAAEIENRPHGEGSSIEDSVGVAPKSKDQEMFQVLSTENNVPIVFYGKLVDQFGSPVADAQITGTTIIRNGFTEGGGRFTAVSDSSGYFKLDCGRGESLGVMPRKPGYSVASLNGGGFYTHLKPESERQHPDPNNPVVIKMWKLQGAEPLIKINQRYRTPFSSESLHFDLLAEQIVPTGGDIEIRVRRTPGTVSERTRAEWGVTLAAIHGGIVDSAGTERVTYWAPDEGYRDYEEFLFSTNAPNKWFGGFNHEFYLKSRNGKVYAKVAISFSINQEPADPMDVTFKGIANTNSSRNWEGDPNTYKQ